MQDSGRCEPENVASRGRVVQHETRDTKPAILRACLANLLNIFLSPSPALSSICSLSLHFVHRSFLLLCNSSTPVCHSLILSSPPSRTCIGTVELGHGVWSPASSSWCCCRSFLSFRLLATYEMHHPCVFIISWSLGHLLLSPSLHSPSLCLSDSLSDGLAISLSMSGCLHVSLSL